PIPSAKYWLSPGFSLTFFSGRTATEAKAGFENSERSNGSGVDLAPPAVQSQSATARARVSDVPMRSSFRRLPPALRNEVLVPLSIPCLCSRLGRWSVSDRSPNSRAELFLRPAGTWGAGEPRL